MRLGPSHGLTHVSGRAQLHAINSAIIKLGKLTKANKVYRGISGMALPKEFWEANEFGVRGGVDERAKDGDDEPAKHARREAV